MSNNPDRFLYEDRQNPRPPYNGPKPSLCEYYENTENTARVGSSFNNGYYSNCNYSNNGSNFEPGGSYVDNSKYIDTSQPSDFYKNFNIFKK